jgi:putative ABC transport system permease protein
MLRDFLFSLRVLGKSPGFTAVVVLTLALGIGANTAIFSVVNASLLRALPYPDADRLCFVWEDGSAFGFPRNTPSRGNYLDWRSQNRTFEEMGATRGQPFNLTGDGEPERIEGHLVTASFFRTMGVQPVTGRYFTDAEDQPESSRVAVISYALWKRRFAGDSSFIGRTIKLNDLEYTVLGVMPSRFQVPGDVSDVWVPMAWTAQERQDRGSHFLTVFGRLKPGVRIEEANTEIAGIAKRLEQQYPDTNNKTGALVIGLREELSGGTRRALIILLATVGFLLLIGCSNVASLMLARSAAREQELVVRAALGAGRGRLIRQAFAESLVLALLGGAAGLVFAIWTQDALRGLVPEAMYGSREVSVDSAVALFGLGISLVTAILFGAAPAIAATRADIAHALKAGARGTIGHGRARGWLMGSEIALAVMLVVGAGLMLRSFAKISGVDPGFRAEGVLTARVSLPVPRYADNNRRIAFYRQARERVSAAPGVESAAFINRLPMTSRGGASGIVIEGQPMPPGRTTWVVNVRSVSPEYFRVMQIPLREGRLLEEKDAIDAAPVRVINATMARKFWGKESPVGKRFAFGTIQRQTSWVTIVGVVGDVRQYALGEEPVPEMYAAIPQALGLGMRDLVVRAKDGVLPESLAGTVRDALRSVDAEVPVSSIATLEEVVARSVADRRLQMLLLALFASLALVLAAVGIYGVVSFSVAQRTREIGVRMAIGAETANILRMIAAQVVPPVLLGMAAGLAAAFLLSRFMERQVYEIKPSDPLSFALAAIVLLVVAGAATIAPARRALRVDPIVALRYE